MGVYFGNIEEDSIIYYHSIDENPVKRNFERHCHGFYEMIFVVEGYGKYIVEGAQYDMQPNTIVFFRPQEYHFVEIPDNKRYERYVIHFTEDALQGDRDMLLVPLFGTAMGIGNFFPCGKATMIVKSILERMDDLTTIPHRQAKDMLSLILSEILLMLSLTCPEMVPVRDEALAVRVIRYLNAHVTEDISLDEIANNFFVSKFYLCRAFKEYNGISIHGYVIAKRIMLAKQMMDNGESASGAAYRVGFGDYSSFYRAYKKIMGRSPTSKNGKTEVVYE